MAAKIFSIASIRRERPVFEDADGQTYEFSLPEDHDLITQATRYRLSKRFDELAELRKDDMGNVAIAEEWVNLFRQSVLIYVPSYPPEKLALLSYNDCQNIMSWWRENVPDPTPPGETETPTSDR